MIEDIIDYRVLSRRTLRARKDYICAMCHRPILAGYAYRREAAIEDGRFVCSTIHPMIEICLAD